MKHISILVLKGSLIHSIDAAQNIFRRVNDFLEANGKVPYFNVELVGLTRTVLLNDGYYAIHPDKLLTDVRHTNLIIVPFLCGNFRAIIHDNKGFSAWLKGQYKDGSEIACLCAGSFFLASTGLLDKKSCAVHWAAAQEFREMFPDIKLIDTGIITDEQGIYTSGGSYSYLNLLLYLIEKFVDRSMAVRISKMFEIEIDRHDQAPYIIFMGHKNHNDELVMKVQEYIEKNYVEKITIEKMASLISVGRRTFERRFKKATRFTISEYIQRVKIEAAKKGFETTNKNITGVMSEVGYSDVKAFRGVFKNLTGLTPFEYRAKYNRQGLHEELQMTSRIQQGF